MTVKCRELGAQKDPRNIGNDEEVVAICSEANDAIELMIKPYMETGKVIISTLVTKQSVSNTNSMVGLILLTQGPTRSLQPIFMDFSTNTGSRQH